MKMINIKHEAKVISCFPGIGKNYAIKELSTVGYRVLSIEKKDKSFDKSTLADTILDNIYKYDIIFIPFYIGIHKDILDKLEYTIIYPAYNCKERYMELYKELMFSDTQLEYLSNDWDEMICYIESLNIESIKLEDLSYDPDYFVPHYLLDVIDY